MTAALLLFGLTLCATDLFAQGVALYKDGQKIIDLQDVITSSHAPQGKIAVSKPAGIEALRHQIFAATRSRPFPERDTYLRTVSECRDQVLRLTAGDGVGEYSPADVGRLLDLKTELERDGQILLAEYQSLADGLAAAGYPGEKLARHAQMVEQCRKASGHLLDLLSELERARTGGDQAGTLRTIGRLRQCFADSMAPWEVEGQNPLPRPMLLQTRALPQIQGDLQGRPPVLYPSADAKRIGPGPGDLDETIDVQFSDQIAALAAELDSSPVQIYGYVRNQLTFEPYLGSRKGSQQTLEHMRGNSEGVSMDVSSGACRKAGHVFESSVRCTQQINIAQRSPTPMSSPPTGFCLNACSSITKSQIIRQGRADFGC
ncbi:MAG: hypothetical protein AB1792_07660 [Candidatus Zixiibacteriota bacterium]